MKPQPLGIMPLVVMVWAVAAPTTRAPVAAQALPSMDAAAVQQLVSTKGTGDLRVGVREFERLLRQGDVLVIDVRDDAAYHRAHIPGAVSVPLDRLEREASRLGRSHARILTYCAGPLGDKGASAAALLRRLGARAYALDGGFQRWVGEGRVVEVPPTTGAE